MVNERRSAARHNLTLTVEVSLGNSLSLHACENLSAGGAFFRHAIPFKVGTRVDVKFTLPGEQAPIHCKGEVANVPAPADFGMGVRFVGLSSEEEQRIGDFAALYGGSA